MRITRTVLGRILQYLGIALAAHALTMHMVVLQIVRSGNPGPNVSASWTHVSIGLCLSLVLFSAGFYLERKL